MNIFKKKSVLTCVATLLLALCEFHTTLSTVFVSKQALVLPGNERPIIIFGHESKSISSGITEALQRDTLLEMISKLQKSYRVLFLAEDSFAAQCGWQYSQFMQIFLEREATNYQYRPSFREPISPPSLCDDQVGLCFGIIQAAKKINPLIINPLIQTNLCIYQGLAIPALDLFDPRIHIATLAHYQQPFRWWHLDNDYTKKIELFTKVQARLSELNEHLLCEVATEKKTCAEQAYAALCSLRKQYGFDDKEYVWQSASHLIGDDPSNQKRASIYQALRKTFNPIMQYQIFVTIIEQIRQNFCVIVCIDHEHANKLALMLQRIGAQPCPTAQGKFCSF